MHIEVILKNFVDLELRDPVLLCSWQGWPDAAESATKSIEEILLLLPERTPNAIRKQVLYLIFKI